MKGTIVTVLLLVFISNIFSCDKSSQNENKNGKEVLVEITEAVETEQISPKIIFECYKKAYPDKIKNVSYVHNDWAVELFDGTIFFWANGRILSDSKRNDWNNYAPYEIYPYRGEPRNPNNYTQEKIDFLRKTGTVEARLETEVVQDMDFFYALFDTATQASTESHIATIYILDGCRVNIHEDIISALERVDTRCMELAKTDNELKHFIDDILIRVDGFHWRLIKGTDRMSNHSYGLAVDVIPPKLDDLDIFWSWIRDDSSDWMLFPQEKLWAPPQSMIDIFREEGFVWGGTWDFYDNMHFEYRPELVELAKQIQLDK